MSTDPSASHFPPEVPPARANDREPLVHVALALAVSVGITLLVFWMLWPERAGQTTVNLALAADSAAPESTDGGSRVLAQLGSLPVRVAPRSVTNVDHGTSMLSPPSGHILHGTVVDEYMHPVPSAEVWILDEAWKVLTHTNQRGAFSEAIDLEEWNRKHAAGYELQLGARSRNHGPSSIQRFSAMPNDALCLMLTGRGAGLRLEVLDQGGSPLPGVLVRISSEASDAGARSRATERAHAPGHATLMSRGTDSQPVAHVPAAPVRTDRWGLANLEGLAAGGRQLTLRKAGYSIRRGRLVLHDGERARRVIKMSANAGLHGQVARLDRGPVRGTRVIVSSDETLQEFEVTCDQFGQFALDGLPSGRVRLTAQLTTATNQRLRCSAEHFLSPGQSAIWDPALEETRHISGQLINSLGTPLAGWRVELEPGSDEQPPIDVKTDEDGRYELPEPIHFAGARLLFYNPLAARGIPTRVVPLSHQERRPRFQLGDGEDGVSPVVGRVIRPNGTGAQGELMVLYRLRDRQSMVIELDAEGRFRTPSLPPGEYLPVFPRHGQGWAPGQAWQVDGLQELRLDTILLPATGQLVLQTSEARLRAESCDLSISLLLPGVSETYKLPIFDGIIVVPAEFSYAPGTYELQLRAADSLVRMEFEIESDGLTTLTLPPAQ